MRFALQKEKKQGAQRNWGVYILHNDGRLEVLIEVESISSFTLHGSIAEVYPVILMKATGYVQRVDTVLVRLHKFFFQVE